VSEYRLLQKEMIFFWRKYPDHPKTYL